MGTHISRDAEAAAGAEGPAASHDEQLSARAWRTGVPFTLLHDEGFVVEKFHELLATSSAQSAGKQSNTKSSEEAQTTVSGLDEAPMDEMQHATDMARIKLFARTKRDGGTGDLGGSRPTSPSSLGPAAASTLTSSTAKENPPSALAGMVGNTLSRESPESADSERLRAQRDKLLQVYFEQIAVRVRHNQMAAVEETAREGGLQDIEGSLASIMPSGSVEIPLSTELPTTDKRREISQNVTAASVFSVGSLRLQLEMLREFRVLSSKLFENGTMTLVQTLLGSPPFALQDVVAGSPEDALLSDVHRFCQDIMHPEQGEQEVSSVQRQVTLLLLLAIGVSSGRISLLLEFVDELLILPRDPANSEPLLLQGYPFTAWVKVFMQRMESYRIDYALGTFEDNTYVKKFAIKTLPGDPENDNAENGSEESNANFTSSLAMDGSFAYTWSLTKGLAKIGTGHNFTIAGRVYAEVSANEYLRRLEKKRTVRKLVYGFGECIKDVSEVARDEMARVHDESSRMSVQDVFGAFGTSDESRLLVSYYAGNVQDVCILENRDIFTLPLSSTENEVATVKVCRAWYGDLDVLNTEAVLHFCNLLEQKRSDDVADSNDLGVTLSHELVEQLLTTSGISLEKMVDSKKLMVVFGCGENSDSVGAQVLEEGNRFVDIEERARDSYMSSLLYCDDSLYLSVMYPDRDVSGMLISESNRRCRRLLRISPQDLGFLEDLPLEKYSSQTSGSNVKCTMPLYAYATEGKLIYEIDMGSGDIGVNVITPKAFPGGGKVLEVTRQFILNEKTVLCSEFLLCLAKIRSAVVINEDKLEVQLPLFYTNGASLGVLIADPNSQESGSSKNRVHCVLFDCESGRTKELYENEERTSCLERSLSSTSVCFDARNNLLWLYDEHKRALRSYQNSGKRIPLDENSIPSDVVSKKTGDGEKPSFIETTALSLLAFLYKNAVASGSTVGNDAGNDSATRVPFAVDVEVETFKLLLAFTSSIEPESEQISRGVDGSTAATSSRLFDFLKDSSSKLLKFMVNLDVLVSMIDPKKRKHTMENVSMALKAETMESSHEYENNMDAITELQMPGATRMVITFDPRSRTEVNYDYLTFYKDKSQGEYYGSQFYSGRDSEQNWPGVGENPPLIIESDHCFVYFHTDGSNTDWGYKFTATAEILERKKSLQQHWIVFLLESVVHLLDESIKILVDGSAFARIDDMEVQNEQYLQSDLLRSGVCTEDNKNTEVLRLLQDFVDLPESSDAEKVIQALQERSGVSRPSLALTRSTSFDQITSSAPNKSVNSAVRAVAAAIFHHNMWGMDAYAFTQNLRYDISEQLLRGWKNAQKMRDWFHLGDAADAGMHGQTAPSRRRSGRLRRQPSAYKGLSEESLAILCDNVIKRARFLLEITPVSFAYVTGAKRRWGLLAKYGHAIGKQNCSDFQLDKWYNLLDELQAATELRSLFQYRRSSSERLKHGQVKSVTEQVLEFIQSDVDISEVRKVIEIRNRRAASRALGMEVFIQSLKDCSSLRLRGVLLESFTTTLKCFAIANSATNVSGSSSVSPVSTLDSFPRLHFDALLSGCDESLRQRIAESFGNCLAIFAKQVASATDDATNSGLVTGMLKCCAMDYDLEDSYLLQESRVLPQILRLLSSDSITTRNAAQSLLGVLLSRFIAGRVESNTEEDGDDDDDDEHAASDAHDVSAFQRQLFAAVGHQLEGIVSAVKSALNSAHDGAVAKSSPQYLPENSPGYIASCLQRNAVSWNHSIMLWVYSPSKGPLYALKLGDEVRRGPTWSGTDELGEHGETEIGTVISIPTPTKVHVRWNLSGLTSQCEFDPKNGIFDVVLVDEGVGGTIFFKGNKNMIKDMAATKPWSHFGLFLTDSRMLVYKIACGSDKESVFETDYEMDADQWSHVAIVQDEDILRVYVNGSMVSQHLLESFLVMNANVNPGESAIIESTHPLEDTIDEYCPVHIPGAVKIRLTFDPLCDIDGSTGFVRFYKDAKCVEYWGEDKYTGKYSDPERNFPGAQSNRARSLQHADASNADLNVLEIPSDRFLVYFHNEGSSNSWGFRILASPELATSEEECTNPVAHLNPYPFYFGESPGRVLDEPAAKCWIYQPKVLNYPISESDLTTEIQTSFPSAEIISNVAPAERTLHILGLIRTCAETSFGRGLIGTPENLQNILLLSFDDRVPVEIRIGAIKVLKDLAGILGTDVMDTQVAKALPGETDGFLLCVFKRLGRALNVWREFEEDKAVVVDGIEEEDAGGDLLELRTSAQGEASLVAAYISLLRGAAEFSCWGDQVFELVIAGLQSVQTLQDKWSEREVGQVLASLALLGGNYGGAYIGGRVSCCVNVDNKEMVETGYLVQFRMKSGTQIARVIFDCDQSNIVDVPLTDVAHLDDIEKTELTSFLKRVTPFASELKDLYQGVLDLTDVSPSVDSYQPKLTKKENVEVLESEHPYAAGEDVTYSLNFRGATEIVIRFDKMSCTAGPNDYIQFKKKEGDLKEGGGNDDKYWGEEKYYGESFPGVGTTPPLRIPAGSVDVHFYTENSSSGISEWGFKLTAHAFEETLIYPPEIPPAIRTSAFGDIRARCIKSFGHVLESLKRADIAPTFTSLLPSLTKIANAPCHGRPIQSSPKSQIFESKHPYANSVMEYMKVTFSGASTLTITFDPQSRTEQGCDYLSFFKDKSLTDRWGAYQYCGVGSDANWPGVEDRPPLVIPADSFTLLWATDGSNVDWGWKFNVTAEFLPEFPLDKSLKQLDARSYRLFETLYEKMSHQRAPLKGEFEEFAGNDDSCKEEHSSDPIRQLLSVCSSKEPVKLAEWGRITSKQAQYFRVADEDGIKIYQEKNRESSVLAELGAGTELTAEVDLDGWLKVSSDNVDQLDKAKCGWIWQRTGDTVHVSPSAACANGEDLLTLGVDDLNFESRHSVLEMDERNDEEKSLTSLCSPFAFDEFKGQTDRIQSLAYDSHRAVATKAAREAILTFLSCDPKRAPIPLSAFGTAEDILLLLSHFFFGSDSDATFDNQSGVLLALRKRLQQMVLSGVDDVILSAVLVQCLEIMKNGPQLLPKGRGAVQILESTHPYQDNADQYWDVSIPGATKIKVIFDRRCKSEAGCDWVRLYKSGSNRTETIGPDQIGGRGDSENWPGTSDRPPLYIEDDSFEVYFHSDSSNNDWGFKMYAIGIFQEEDKLSHTDTKNPETVMKLLSMTGWILEALSSIPDSSFRASPTTLKMLYSAETLQTLMLSLNESPQCIKTCALQILSNITQSAAFHTIPAVLIEHVRDLMNVKMRAKYQAEERVELKSPYLQTLVQCAVALDLSIDSHCFGGVTISDMGSISSLPYQLGTDGVATFVSRSSTSTSGCYQFLMNFHKLASAVTIGLSVGEPGPTQEKSASFVQWEDSGKLSCGTRSSASGHHDFNEIHGNTSRIREGDTVVILVDLYRQTLAIRKNSILAALVAGPAGSGALVPWDELHPTLQPESDIRLVVSHSGADNRIEFSSLSCSPLALIPQSIVPSWYGKVVDAVSMMLDFRENLSLTVISRESRHPLASSAPSKPVRELIDINGAVALEIRFDKRTKLQKSDELHFYGGPKSETSEDGGDPLVVLSGINGEQNETDAPHLFAVDGTKQRNYSLSVGDLVVRSHDWEYSDEDGGAGNVGIVQEITSWGSHGGKGVRVRWQENGFETVYRYGLNARYDVQNLELTKYQSAPLIIRGSAISYEFVRGTPQATTRLDLSTSSEFTGSLELDGSMRLDLKLVKENERVLSKSDCSVEFWAFVSKDVFDKVDGNAYMEVLRIDGARGRVILLSDRLGRCTLALQAVDTSGELVEHHQCREDVRSDSASSGNIVFGQWIHLALVFSGSRVLVVKNGDVIYSVRCTEHDRLHSVVICMIFGYGMSLSELSNFAVTSGGWTASTWCQRAAAVQEPQHLRAQDLYLPR
ncbi:hypothetical protein PC115_g9264 [Phytophthora cactorum]|uniref:MIB/HERC2 domain-containing protein n=1 Tax=Phytophthora cactorum TaxID=29920 RepID=A0A8T1CLJ8_9STRA|nr:hypothetical protein PC115_g9264 [Phytophthora cactorum]